MLKFILPNSHLKLEISNDIMPKLFIKGQKAFPNETGGFLIGEYSNDKYVVHIRDIVVPIKIKSGTAYYERSTVGMENLWDQLHKRSKFIYLGEWHSHPNGSANFSVTDLSVMKTIANSDNVRIKHPILLIMSLTKCNNFDYKIYCYDNGGLKLYQEQI